jgi:hypothetical protein
MAQTQRTVSEIYALGADNIGKAISPQDLRDALATWRPGHGQIYVAAADRAAINIVGVGAYVEVTAPAWTLSADGHLFDESDGNGRLTYIGVADVMVHIVCTVSVTCGADNQVTHWRLGKNATTDAASEIKRKIGTGADVGALAVITVQPMSTGDYVSLWCRNSTAINDITVEVATLQAMTMPA